MSKIELNGVQEKSSNILITQGSRHRPPYLQYFQNIKRIPMRCNGFRTHIIYSYTCVYFV